jgi:hypothetical protein
VAAVASHDVRDEPDAVAAGDAVGLDIEVDLDLDLDLGEVGGPRPDAPRGARVRGRHLALAAAALAGCAGAVGGNLQHAAHQNALAARADAISAVVARAAGSGVDSVFDFGYRGSSSTLTLSGDTIIYAVCEKGQLSIGGRRYACNGRPVTLGPFGKAGDVVPVTLPASPWGIIVRPMNVFYLSPAVLGRGYQQYPK